jgi:hypothetical protein
MVAGFCGRDQDDPGGGASGRGCCLIRARGGAPPARLVHGALGHPGPARAPTNRSRRGSPRDSESLKEAPILAAVKKPREVIQPRWGVYALRKKAEKLGSTRHRSFSAMWHSSKARWTASIWSLAVTAACSARRKLGRLRTQGAGGWLLTGLTALAIISLWTEDADARRSRRESWISQAASVTFGTTRTITVREYTRRDGTVVREHTRRIPARHKARPSSRPSPIPPQVRAAPKVTAVGPLEPGGLWNLGGSLLYLNAESSRRKFVYEKPREELTKRGVRKSTVYFDGEFDGTSLRGTAHAFFPNCAPIGYPVTGELSPDRRQITLRGKMPEANAECKIVDHRDREITLVYQGPRCDQTDPDLVTCR